jgi:16S rRNA (uracil1498-N3)-methyltransferase
VNPALRHSAAHVFVGSLTAPQLDGGDVHHLTRVLRLRPGASVTASDGCGNWVGCTLRAGGELEVSSDVVAMDAPARRTTIATAIPKGDRPELIVQKLTEIGIDRIVFVSTARTVVRWDDQRGERQLDRLRRIAREAAMQSRRVWLPEVDGVRPVADVLAGSDRIVVAEPGGRDIAATDDMVVIGPEGGFDPAELPDDVDRVRLASTVLRVETAAIVAGALLVASRT